LLPFLDFAALIITLLITPIAALVALGYFAVRKSKPQLAVFLLKVLLGLYCVPAIIFVITLIKNGYFFI
jgi:hypothetical protein